MLIFCIAQILWVRKSKMAALNGPGVRCVMNSQMLAVVTHRAHSDCWKFDDDSLLGDLVSLHLDLPTGLLISSQHDGLFPQQNSAKQCRSFIGLYELAQEVKHHHLLCIHFVTLELPRFNMGVGYPGTKDHWGHLGGQLQK